MELNQVTLPAIDVAASVAFYRKMGFEIIVDSPQYARFKSAVGDATFSIHAVDASSEPSKTIVYFECSSLDAQVAMLQAKGMRFAQEPRAESWLWCEARLLDPAGNVICLYYAGENRLNPPWRVKASPGEASALRKHSNNYSKEEMNMSELRYPNESREYREAREALLKDEQELVDKVKSVAERRRTLPLGGQLKEDYVFQWANDGKVGQSVKFSELFGDKNTLLLYSFMFGPSWDNPCLSCTSLVDGFDRTWYQVNQDAAFVAIAKAPAERINTWAKRRGWSQIPLVSGSDSPYQADYKCQEESDDMQLPVMHVFRKQDGKIYHFWGTEQLSNHLDTVWPYWNLMDFTPEGRPDIPTPPQTFRSEFLEKNYLNRE